MSRERHELYLPCCTDQFDVQLTGSDDDHYKQHRRAIQSQRMPLAPIQRCRDGRALWVRVPFTDVVDGPRGELPCARSSLCMAEGLPFPQVGQPAVAVMGTNPRIQPID